MDKKIILFVLALLCVLPSVLANWCYQESANVSTSCGANGNGSYGNTSYYRDIYPPYKAFDGDWTTLASTNTTTPSSLYIYINYTKFSSSSVNNSLWMVKAGNIIINYSIPSTCANLNILQFRMESYRSNPPYDIFSNLTCYDGSNWLVINDSIPSVLLYEEAMWWNNIVTILFPSLQDLKYNYNINISYNISDNNIDKIWYSNNSGIINTSLNNTGNFSQTWVQGLNNITIYMNTTNGFNYSMSRWFYIDTVLPSINLNANNPNLSLIFNNISNIVFNMSFYDLNNISTINLTCINVNTGQVEYQNITTVNVQNYNFTPSKSFSNVSVKSCNILINDSYGNYANTTFTFQVYQGVTFISNGYNLVNRSNININVNITYLSTTYQFSGINGINLTVPCTSAAVVIAANNYYNTYNYFYNNCTEIPNLINVSFYQAKLTVNVNSTYANVPIYGSNITIKNGTYVNSTLSNPAIFYLNLGLYMVNITSGISDSINTSTYLISLPGEYDITYYLIPNVSIFFYDEQTRETFNISSPDSIYQYVYCNDTTVITTLINVTNFSVVAPCNYDKIRYVVNYPADSYYRTFLANSNIGNLTKIFLVDLDHSTIIFNTFQLYTLTDSFTNPKLFVTKNINGTNYIITADSFNVETKVGTYLLYGEQYTLITETDEDGQKNLGFYTADSTGEKLIKYFNLAVGATPTGTLADNSWYVSIDNVTGANRIVTTYNSKDVFSSMLNVYNDSLSGVLLYSASLTSENGTFYYTPAAQFVNNTFQLRLDITKDDGSVVSFEKKTIGSAIGGFVLDIVLFDYISDKFFAWILIVVLSCVALIFTFNTASVGGIFFIGMAWLFTWLGWIEIGAVALGLSIAIAIGNLIKNQYR